VFWCWVPLEGFWLPRFECRAGRRAEQPTHPGALLREDVLPALGMNVKDLAGVVAGIPTLRMA
jgi:hypothetical protein